MKKFLLSAFISVLLFNSLALLLLLDVQGVRLDLEFFYFDVILNVVSIGVTIYFWVVWNKK